MIVIHAGMPKTGTTAVQLWLEQSRAALSGRGIVAVRARASAGHVVVETPTDDRGLNSGGIIDLLRDRQTVERATAELVAGLREQSRDHDVVVISGEALAQVFWRSDTTFLRVIQELGEEEPVRVAYYVRPQHSALEAAWRQWGFRGDRPPSAYIAYRAKQGAHYRYLATMEHVRRVAPSLGFAPRLFRRDHLVEGDVVSDFAATFLEVAPVGPEGARDNLGVSLQVANLLHHEVAAILGESVHDNRRFNILKAALEDLQLPEHPATEAGRRVLATWCSETFGADNDELAEMMGWTGPPLVPANPGPSDLSLLDELWLGGADESAGIIARHFAQRFVSLRHATVSANAAIEDRLERLGKNHEQAFDRLRTAHGESSTASQEQIADLRRELAEQTRRAGAATAELARLRDRRVVKLGLGVADGIGRVTRGLGRS